MKKKYVKPVMESEEFVANEYVAACWDVYCEGSVYGWGHQKDGFVERYKNDVEPDWGNRDADPFSTQYKLNGDSIISSVHVYRDTKNEEHYIARYESTPGHPNASI